VFSSLSHNKYKKPDSFVPGFNACGERGIRTPGAVTLNGFQDRRIRPLCHFSGAKVVLFFFTPNNQCKKKIKINLVGKSYLK
jgi:hypothetical protein